MRSVEPDRRPRCDVLPMESFVVLGYLSVGKLYCVNFGEFTVFFEAGDEEKKQGTSSHALK